MVIALLVQTHGGVIGWERNVDKHVCTNIAEHARCSRRLSASFLSVVFWVLTSRGAATDFSAWKKRRQLPS